jgi:hypothetical protein
MTSWDFFVEQVVGSMYNAGQLRICIGFCVERLGQKELNCVLQLFTYAQEIGILADSEREFDAGLAAIQCAAESDSRWRMVRMVSPNEPDEPRRWHVYSTTWFEGRY